MKDAEEWMKEISLFRDLKWTPQTISKEIKRIQLDALLEAADIASDHLYVGQEDSTGRKIHDAILARAKEVEAQPHSTDEKKI